MEFKIEIKDLETLFIEKGKIYTNKKRLILAKELIRNGEHLNVVYGLCGFQDNTSFFRAFRKEYDMTPKSYQLQYKEFMRKN